MRKLLSILVAAVFVISTGSVFAASHMKAAGEKTDEMKTEQMSKAEKKEKKAAKKAAKKAKRAKAAAKQDVEMKKESEKK